LERTHASVSYACSGWHSVTLDSLWKRQLPIALQSSVHVHTALPMPEFGHSYSTLQSNV
jgi:hypothetical protein